MMRCSRMLVRIAANCLGVFLILSVTAEQFDATELTAVLAIAALLLTVELAVALTPQRKSSGAARLEPMAIVLFAGLLWISCSNRAPVYHLSPESYAAVAALRST